MKIELSEIVTPSQVAAILGTTKQQVSRWIRQGRLVPAGEVGGKPVFRRSTLATPPPVKPGRKPPLTA